MSFFTSEYECKLDAKGRMVLPARIKSNLPAEAAHELVLRMGFEPVLVVYPKAEYLIAHDKIAQLSEFNPEQRALKRHFFRSISQVELDSNGRFLIPKQMLLHAKLDKDAIVVGTGNTIEIWNPDVYKQYVIDDQDQYPELARKFLDL
jgi:MraZ protein